MNKLEYNFQAAKEVLEARIKEGTNRERYKALMRFCDYCDMMVAAGASPLEMRARKSAAKTDIFNAIREA